MRPEIASRTLAFERTGGLRLPDALLSRAREGRRQKQQRAQRAREVGHWAHQALLGILRGVDSGALTCHGGAAALPALESGSAVEPVTPHRPGPLAVAFDYRPTAAGRLKSRLARRVAEDPLFLRDAQAALQRALGVLGYECLFHTHLIQRFVASGERGYHVTVRVQLLVALRRKNGAQGSTM